MHQFYVVIVVFSLAAERAFACCTFDQVGTFHCIGGGVYPTQDLSEYNKEKGEHRSGIGGNEDDGNSLVSETVNPSDVHIHKICLQEPDQGSCKLFRTRFYYSRKTHTCQQFSYGGCGGNGNNFLNEKDCKTLCVR